MDFQLSQEQRDLKAGVRALLDGRFGRAGLRAAVEARARGQRLDRGLWSELAEAGLFTLRVPEADGGVGLGTPEAVLAFEEAGRALLPGPLVATHLAATHVTAGSAGSAGDAVVALADAGERPLLVEHLADADAVLVLDGDRAFLADPEAFGAEPVPPLDPLTPLYRPAGIPDGSDGRLLDVDVGALRRTGALLTAALQLGSASRTVELAVDHARDRTQFGRPIGAFQAVKHLCADMLVRAETARAAVYAASVTEDPADVAAAKLLGDDAAVRNARDCLQVHGGMGFTWEADVHLHLKRAWTLAARHGGAAGCEEALAAAL